MSVSCVWKRLKVFTAYLHRQSSSQKSVKSASTQVKTSSWSEVQVGGDDKSNLFTGRFCKIPGVRRIREKYLNSTQTFLKRVVPKCPWNSLYCNKRVRLILNAWVCYCYCVTYQSVFKMLPNIQKITPESTLKIIHR